MVSGSDASSRHLPLHPALAAKSRDSQSGTCCKKSSPCLLSPGHRTTVLSALCVPDSTSHFIPVVQVFLCLGASRATRVAEPCRLLGSFLRAVSPLPTHQLVHEEVRRQLRGVCSCRKPVPPPQPPRYHGYGGGERAW